MRKVILAGVLGGVCMFVWMSIAHMVLPLGMVGIKEIPKEEQAVLAAMTASLGNEHGMYLYPSMGAGPNPSMAEERAAMANYQQKLATMPSGVLIYNPPGQKAMEPRQLIVEFLSEMILSLIAVWLLAQTALRSFGGRVAFVSMAGLLAVMLTNVQYWNWYKFPGSYTLANMITQFVGFVLVGIVAAWMFRRSKPLGFAARG